MTFRHLGMLVGMTYSEGAAPLRRVPWQPREFDRAAAWGEAGDAGCSRRRQRPSTEPPNYPLQLPRAAARISSRSALTPGSVRAAAVSPPIVVRSRLAAGGKWISNFQFRAKTRPYGAGHHHARAAAGRGSAANSAPVSFWPSRAAGDVDLAPAGSLLPGMITATLGTRGT